MLILVTDEEQVCPSGWADKKVAMQRWVLMDGPSSCVLIAFKKLFEKHWIG